MSSSLGLKFNKLIKVLVFGGLKRFFSLPTRKSIKWRVRLKVYIVGESVGEFTDLPLKVRMVCYMCLLPACTCMLQPSCGHRIFL